MALVEKCLYQGYLNNNNLTDTYTVPASTKATIRSIFLCNQHTSAITVRLSVAVAGAADATKQYIYRDLSLAAGDTVTLNAPLFLSATDLIRAKSSDVSGYLSVNIYGMERSV